MKKLIFAVVCLLLLTVQAQAVDLPSDLTDAVPKEAEDFLEGQSADDAGDLARGHRQYSGAFGRSGWDGDPNTSAGSCSRVVCGGFVRRGGRALARELAEVGPQPFAHGGGPFP